MQAVKFLAAVFAALAFGTLANQPALATPAAIYDESASAAADIAAALSAGAQRGKLVLIVFGANWCPDCRALDGMAKEGVLKKVLDEGYVVVHVDVGRFNKNLDVAAKYLLDVRKGIPCAVVLAANGTPALAATVDGRMMDGLMKGRAPALAVSFGDIATRFKPVR